jgi:hypothetical protein
MNQTFYNKEYYDTPKTEKKITGGYEDYSWERLGYYFKDTANHIVTHFKPTSTFDIGTGKGFLIKSFLKLGVDAYGLDFSKYAISQSDVQDRISCLDLKKDISETKTRKYDVVTCFDCVEHIEDKYIDKVIQDVLDLAGEYAIFYIPDEEFLKTCADSDESHISIHSTKYWKEKFMQNEDFEYMNNTIYIKPLMGWFCVPSALHILKRKFHN